MSMTVALLVAAWVGGAFSGLIATASRFRYEELRDEMKLEAIASRGETSGHIEAKEYSMRCKREERATCGVTISILWPVALPAIAAGYALSVLVKLAQKPGERLAREHGLVAIETEVKDCND